MPEGTPNASQNTMAEPPARFLQFTATPGPRFDSDVLFLAGNKLERWRPTTKQVIVLASDVVEFAANDSNMRIGLLQTNNITANGAELFSLSMLDYRTRESTTLLKETSRLHNLKLSPDGQWLSYATLEDQGTVRIISTDGENRSQHIGQCTQMQLRQCGENLAWSPDSRTLLYSDDRGLWRGEVGREEPVLLFSNLLDIKDPRGEQNQVEVGFEDLDWSPAGRYAMAWVQVQESGVRWKGIIDTRVIRVVELPGTYELLSKTTNAIWTQDGGLFLVHGGRTAEHIEPYIQFWSVRPTDQNLLLLESTFRFGPGQLIVQPTEAFGPGDFYPAWLHQLYENVFAFVLSNLASSNTTTLVTFDAHNNVLQPVAELPISFSSISWAPTNTGALVSGQQKELIYTSLNGGEPIDLRSVLGRETCCYSWLPPAPISR